MGDVFAMLRSDDHDLIRLCQEVSHEVGLTLIAEPSIANFLLQLLGNDFKVVCFDFDNMNSDNLKWVKLIRQLRPKIPLIVICHRIDRCLGAQIHEQGVFYLCCRPIHRHIIREVFSAALKYSHTQSC